MRVSKTSTNNEVAKEARKNKIPKSEKREEVRENSIHCHAIGEIN